jgi:CHAT domain-containing protein
MVTLIPIGLLSLLPLHAAGVSQDRHAGVFSAVRYAPNARVLDRCRATAAASRSAPPSLFVADVPDGHGLSPDKHLHFADHETTAIADMWTDAERERHLQHGCRWADFRRQADDYSVWHIACHGGMRASTALGRVGTLYFADAEVGIEQLRAEIRHAPRRLAILSACESHLTSASLPNETIGLPSALLQLGFAGVIATTWSIDDAATPYLMAYFHRVWCSGDTHPAVALNRAQRWLARASRAELCALLPTMGPITTPGEHPFADPLYWAGFAYTGA